MWRIGNCYLPTSVHIPLSKQSEIPPPISLSRFRKFRCGRYFAMWEISSPRDRKLLGLTTQSWCVGNAVGLKGKNLVKY